MATILSTVTDGVCLITVNRPKRFNALDNASYYLLAQTLRDADANPDVVVAVITGKGQWYSSGNDLANFMNMLSGGGDVKTMANDAVVMLEDYVNAWIDFSKPLIAAVNGPAMGVAVTTLALCDIVYCTADATFNTPFSKLGQSPEGLSSYLFPRLMGQSKANEVLLFGKTLSAQEAVDRNLVAEVFPNKQTFLQEVLAKATTYAQFPAEGLVKVKALINGPDREILRTVNKAECKLLAERFASEECATAIMKFMMEQQQKRKQKKKKQARRSKM
jgi:peroxisomal 3,2-trans-enoyl-CoA isomerase